ncbi:hypothetical protein Trydic_g3458 [Trypoxylus dichotomus]
MTGEEVKFAVQQIKEGRAPGPDNFRSEISKLLDESTTIQMTNLLNYIYQKAKYRKSESWTLPEGTTKEFPVFETWLYRRIVGISWTEHVSNEEVCRRMEKDAELIATKQT